jgi:hypothetical protein
VAKPDFIARKEIAHLIRLVPCTKFCSMQNDPPNIEWQFIFAPFEHEKTTIG